MKYYKHKETNLIMASMEDLFSFTTGCEPDGYPLLINHLGCTTRVIFPEKSLGNGVTFHMMKYSDIIKNFKRINKEKFFELCKNDFGQLRHHGDDTINRKKYTTLFEGVEKRKLTFGRNNPNKVTAEKLYE